MAKSKENICKQNFRIKLLAGNNVVLVEADNYESEIFTPQIVDGHITFLNIIPNRRCCHITGISKTSFTKFITRGPNGTLKSLPQQNLGIKKFDRKPTDQDSFVTPVPLANSTPANIKQRTSCGITPCSNVLNSNRNDSALSTPEPVRRANIVRSQVLEKSMVNLPNLKLAHDGSLNSSFSLQSPNFCRLNGSFRLMTSPTVSGSSMRNKRSILGSSTVATLDSIARWHKVLTPVRTYTKASKKPVMLQRPVFIASSKKTFKPRKVIPTYLVNPTQGPNVTQCIEIKKRKLIIDKKLSISPKTFKRQQYEKLDTCQIASKSLTFPKSRQHQDSISMSAFDLLTNSNRSHCMSRKLNQQFRKGCVNKASSTYSKYKILSTIPALEQDEQILEMSSISKETSRPTNKRVSL